MKCQCGAKDQNHSGVWSSETLRHAKKVLDKKTTFRACMNPECKDYKVIENRCTRCNSWVKTEHDGVAVTCKCRHEKEIQV